MLYFGYKTDRNIYLPRLRGLYKLQGYRAIEVKSFKNIQIGYRNIFMTALRDNHEIIPILIRLSMASNRKWEGVTENAPIT